MMAGAQTLIDGIYYNLNSDTKTAEVTNKPDYYIDGVIIPETVTEIGDDAFDGCGDVCIMAPSGSYAEQYAQDNNLNFVPMEE